MSVETKVGNAFSVACESIKQRVTSNVVEAVRQGKFNISDHDLGRLVAFIQQTIDQASRATVKSILSSLKE